MIIDDIDYKFKNNSRKKYFLHTHTPLISENLHKIL